MKKWVLLDDFQDCCVEYDSLSGLANNNIGWFFGVYQQKGEVAGKSSDFEISFARNSVDCHQNNIKGSDERTFVSKTHRTTDKVVLRDHPNFQ